MPEWLQALGVTTLFIEPASPWENGYIESFNGKLKDELLNGEIFNTLREAQMPIANWRRLCNGLRPHSALVGGQPPAPKAVAFPEFSLKEDAPSVLVREPASALSREVDDRMESGQEEGAVTAS